MDDDTWSVMQFIIGAGIAIILVCAIGTLFWQNVINKPYRDNAFNGQVQGLITEYCTAPRSDDQLAARQQLMQLIDGKPDEFKTVPSTLQDKAKEVYYDNRSVCK